MARPPRCAWHAYRHQPSRRWGTYTSRLHGRSKAVMVRPHSITVSGAGRHQSDYAISLGIDSRPYAGVCRLASPRVVRRPVGSVTARPAILSIFSAHRRSQSLHTPGHLMSLNAFPLPPSISRTSLSK